MSNSVWDKSLISFAVSPLVGILVMTGVIAPQHADLVAQQAELWVGATIFLGGLLIGVLHHNAIQANALQNALDLETLPLPPDDPVPPDGQLPIDHPVVSVAVPPDAAP